MTVRPLRDGRYVVETDGGTYVVDLREESCTCPDQAIRGTHCKHLRRLEIEIEAGTVEPPAWGVCAACGASLTDRNAANEGRELPLCDDCRLDAGELVRDRETGRLLVVAAVTDDRADEVEIEAAGTTVAAYPTNAHYGAHEPVIEAVYLTEQLTAHRERRRADAAGTATPRRYSFPRTRLTFVLDEEGVRRMVATGDGPHPGSVDRTGGGETVQTTLAPARDGDR